jgi:porin
VSPRRVGLLCLGLVGSLGLGIPSPANADDETRSSPESLGSTPHLTSRWWGLRRRLEESDVFFEAVYTGDVMSNTKGGLATKTEVLGNLDLTLTWHTEALLDRDLGTFFAYGLLDHGGRISRDVGDAQGVDNIEAPDAFKIFEAWWQESLFDDRASLLLGLYDVNSEFYAVDDAELFVQSSFGIGAELGTSGRNGPSIFPATSLAARVRAEPIPGFQLQAALTDGVPDDPEHPRRNRVRLSADDGAFLIAEVSYSPSDDASEPDAPSHSELRRHVGRTWSQRPSGARVAIGTWLYTARQPDLARTKPNGDPRETRGHPGIYLTADLDAGHIDPMHARGLAVFLQLGWADGNVGQFAGYTGAGLKYTGLIPSRPEDECGVAVAAAYNGRAFRRSSRSQGRAPATAEVAIEWTYRAVLAPWLSLQPELQYVVDPGGLRDRPDALVAGIRYVIDF